MHPLHLTEDLLIDQQMIDRDHQQLFLLANKLLTRIKRNARSEDTVAVVRALITYVTQHLQREEELAEWLGYPSLARLKAGHAEFRAEAKSIWEEMTMEGPSKKVFLRAHILIADQFVQHIRTLDKELAKFIRGIRAGTAGNEDE